VSLPSVPCELFSPPPTHPTGTTSHGIKGFPTRCLAMAYQCALHLDKHCAPKHIMSTTLVLRASLGLRSARTDFPPRLVLVHFNCVPLATDADAHGLHFPFTIQPPSETHAPRRGVEAGNGRTPSQTLSRTSPSRGSYSASVSDSGSGLSMACDAVEPYHCSWRWMQLFMFSVRR